VVSVNQVHIGGIIWLGVLYMGVVIEDKRRIKFNCVIKTGVRSLP
jgi:hypothetical protein